VLAARLAVIPRQSVLKADDGQRPAPANFMASRQTTAVATVPDRNPGWIWSLKAVTRHARAARSFSVALKGRLGQAYNEDAFRYLLAIERNRGARLGRPFLLALIGLRSDRAHPGARVERAVAAKLFSCLWLCLRETDVVGWYREDRVAGAVLSQVPEGHVAELCQSIRRRVSAALAASLPAEAGRRVQVHVYPLRPRAKE
jgi:hypothetical protein